VKRCLARFAELAVRVKDENSSLVNSSPVRKHLLHIGDIGAIHQRQFLELAHVTVRLRAGEVALARMHTQDLARRGDLETLRRSLMRLQLALWFCRISWHCRMSPMMSGPLRRLSRLLRTRSGYPGAFLRRQQGHQNVAFHPRHRLDLPELADFTEQARHFRAADFLVGHFSAAVENHSANFVAFPEKANDLVLANLIIVFRGGWPEFDLFQLRAAAALALLMRLLVLLVKKLAVIGDFANGRVCRRRNFHQIESAFPRHTNSLVWLHHPKLGALLINHPHFARPNPLIDAGAVALPEAAFCDNSPYES
jgi:hypothetical protein